MAHWTDTYGPHRPVAVIRYRDHEEMEEDLNTIALTPGNRWQCDTPFSEGEYGYTCIFSLTPNE